MGFCMSRENEISVQNMEHRLISFDGMRETSPKRRIRMRLRAAVLLVCMLLAPLRIVAAPWLSATPECCAAGMCKPHGHAKQEKKAEPSCEHERGRAVSDYAMRCGEATARAEVVRYAK